MNQKGAGLIEILIAVVIGVVVFSGTTAALYQLFALNEGTKNQTQIYQDMSAVMERIDSTSMNLLNTRYPNGQSISSGEVGLITSGQGYQVSGESITVSYPSGTNTNPREIVVTANWNDRGRPKSMSIRTFKRG